MTGVRRGARAVLKYFAPLYVVLIVIQVFLAGEGIFRLYGIKHADDCNSSKAAKLADCHATATTLKSTTLDAHRFLGFFLTQPLALLFLIAALLAWHPSTRVRVATIVAPILTFVQLVLAGIGGWTAGLHPVNAFLVLGLFGWLTYQLRQEQAETAEAPAAVAVPGA
jgi:hypothetical protein